MKIDVRPAQLSDVHSVAAILTEAAQWIESSGIGMWRAEEVSAGRIERDVADGLFHLAHADQPLGTIKFQLSDVEFWPEFPEGQAAFVHRLAVRREQRNLDCDAGVGGATDANAGPAVSSSGL